MNENENLGEKRVLETSEKKGLQIRDLILVAVLLAAGAVLKFFVGSLINIGGGHRNSCRRNMPVLPGNSVLEFCKRIRGCSRYVASYENSAS